MELIYKDALLAEIERLKAEALQKKSQCKRSGLEKIIHQIGAYNKILSFINTLEVKEVDLEKESLTWEDMMIIHKHIKDAMNKYLYAFGTMEGQQKIYEDVLRRFKVQKGE